MHAALVYGRHCNAALLSLAANRNEFAWKTEGLHMLLLIKRDGEIMLLQETILYSRSCNNMEREVLSHQSFLSKLKSIIEFLQTFDLDCEVQFVNARTSYIAQNLPISNFLAREAYSQACNTFVLQSLRFATAQIFTTSKWLSQIYLE